MTRIHVTGNAGSGKTTLAAEIGAALDVPVFGLDEIVWLPGWRLNPAEPRAAAETELIHRPAWIIEGVSRRVRNAADIVIFLDEPRRICLFRCASRNWRFLFRSRPGLPTNCPELLILPRLVSIIWNFPKDVRPRILHDIEQRPKTALVVRTKAEREAVITALTSLPRNASEGRS